MVIDKETKLHCHELTEEGKSAYGRYVSENAGLCAKVKKLFWIFVEFVLFFANSGYENEKIDKQEMTS